jgi:HEAT repeat protein
MFGRLGLWAGLGLSLVGIAAAADEIRMKDGTVIHGVIVAEVGEEAYIQTASESLLAVKKAQIKEVVVPKITSPERPVRDPGPSTGPTRQPTSREPLKPIAPPAVKPRAPGDVERQIEAVLSNRDQATLEPNSAIMALAKAGGGHPELLHWRLDGLLRSQDARAYLLLEAIGESRGAGALGRILPYLGHSDPAVRRAAAKAAGRTGEIAAVQLLVRHLSDRDDMVVDAAVQSLKLAGDEGFDIRGPIVDLSYQPQPGTRIGAVKAMARIGADWGLARIVELFDDADAAVRLQALQSAEAYGETADADAAIRRLDDPAYEVKVQACKLVGRLRAREAVPTLIFLLSSGREELEQAALGALHRISGKGFGADQEQWMRWWDVESQKPGR